MDSVALGCPQDSLEGFSQVWTHLTDGAQRSLGDLSGDVSSWEGEAGLPDSYGVSFAMMLLCHNVPCLSLMQASTWLGVVVVLIVSDSV